MIISIIVAAGLNGAIGFKNSLLWHLPDDFKRFRQLTMDKPVIMGRKTFESIGKPLPGRLNIVITGNENFSNEGISVVNSVSKALELARSTGTEEAFIIGGGMIYNETMPLVNRIYLTLVNTSPEADTFFEIQAPVNWKETFREHHPSDSRHEFAFDFIDYQRV